MEQLRLVLAKERFSIVPLVSHGPKDCNSPDDCVTSIYGVKLNTAKEI